VLGIDLKEFLPIRVALLEVYSLIELETNIPRNLLPLAD
jgi:hypothetical protein